VTITRLTPASDLPELLRVEEATAWLDVGQHFVRELIARGELPSVRIGRLVRVPRWSLIAMRDTGLPKPKVVRRA
jgi:excisionase family DNA binding protein